MLKNQCEEAKSRMKLLDDKTLGSFKNAVTTGDAAYLTIGAPQQKFDVYSYK